MKKKELKIRKRPGYREKKTDISFLLAPDRVNEEDLKIISRIYSRRYPKRSAESDKLYASSPLNTSFSGATLANAYDPPIKDSYFGPNLARKYAYYDLWSGHKTIEAIFKGTSLKEIPGNLMKVNSNCASHRSNSIAQNSGVYQASQFDYAPIDQVQIIPTEFPIAKNILNHGGFPQSTNSINYSPSNHVDCHTQYAYAKSQEEYQGFRGTFPYSTTECTAYMDSRMKGIPYSSLFTDDLFNQGYFMSPEIQSSYLSNTLANGLMENIPNISSFTKDTIYEEQLRGFSYTSNNWLNTQIKRMPNIYSFTENAIDEEQLIPSASSFNSSPNNCNANLDCQLKYTTFESSSARSNAFDQEQFVQSVSQLPIYMAYMNTQMNCLPNGSIDEKKLGGNEVTTSPSNSYHMKDITSFSPSINAINQEKLRSLMPARSSHYTSNMEFQEKNNPYLPPFTSQKNSQEIISSQGGS